MNERPIIFSGEMARAILDGRKTQTRRVVKCNHESDVLRYELVGDYDDRRLAMRFADDSLVPCPYGKVSDRLWVRESFLGWKSPILGLGDVVYQGEPEYDKCLADVPHVKKVQEKNPGIVGNWANIPSIHMPRWASRITLEITNVRVERLQDISEEDAKAEGVEPTVFDEFDIAEIVTNEPESEEAEILKRLGPGQITAKTNFAVLWNKINGKTHPWSSNPFVWVIDFKVIKRPDNN